MATKPKPGSSNPSVLSFFKKKKADFVKDKVAQQIVQAELNENPQTSEREDEEKSNTAHDVEYYRKKNVAMEKELKYAKQLLRHTSALLLEKDITIKKLSEKNGEKSAAAQKMLFTKYANQFEDDELKIIRSSMPGAKNDSNFVLNIMRGLYKGNEMKKLKNRTATSRKNKGSEKHEISFEKKDLITEMFKERLTAEHQDDVTESSKRFKRLNDLLRSAIHNIIRRDQKPNKRMREGDSEFEEPRDKKAKSNNSASNSSLEQIIILPEGNSHLSVGSVQQNYEPFRYAYAQPSQFVHDQQEFSQPGNQYSNSLQPRILQIAPYPHYGPQQNSSFSQTQSNPMNQNGNVYTETYVIKY